MITLDGIQQLRHHISQQRLHGKRIALVPTMGNLHGGHIALVRTAQQHADFVVASIFVNPMQFGANEDLDKYPRTLQEDQAKLAAAGCHLLFTPSVSEVYPDGMQNQTRVTVPALTTGLCGSSRPGHFDGVTTVVCKLFNMVQPDIAVFGEKDFQQLAVIRKMAHDLNLPIEIMGSPTIRADDGLALSSRNGYLDSEQRTIAPELHRILRGLADAVRKGQRDYPALLAEGRSRLKAAGFRLDYLELCEQSTLEPANTKDMHLVLLAAVYLGPTRLIDNLSIRLSE